MRIRANVAFLPGVAIVALALGSGCSSTKEANAEIVIDLGARHSLTGMRYTPRQDGIQNGLVKDYELYVSESTSDWGTAVKTGSFGTGTQPTTVTFAAKAGRYVRFRGMSEAAGKPYTCVAELDVAGTAL